METVSKRRKKAGRPAKAIKKEIRTTIRFTKAEQFIIRKRRQKPG